MAVTKAGIQSWIDTRPEDATHMIVVCDTYDWDDYPVFVGGDGERKFPFTRGNNVREAEAEMAASSMQKVMEVYSFTGVHTIEAQMAESRAFHYD